MAKQDYEHHVRYYPTHHFVFYPVVCTAAGLSIWCTFHYTSYTLLWLAITGLFFLVAWLSFMVRQHYALMNQNRIVRLEIRYRYYILTQKRFEEIEPHLTFGQIAALRFASDEELPQLTLKTVSENSTPDQIKRAIKNWLPDTMRV